MAGKLFLTILQYVNDKNPVITDLTMELIFEPIKQKLKVDLKAWEETKIKKSDGGKKGMEQRWHKETVTPDKIVITKDNIVKDTVTPITVTVTDTVSVTDTVNAIVNETVTESLKEKKSQKKQKHSFRESVFFEKEKFSAAVLTFESPYRDCNVDFYYEACLNGSDANGYQYLDWMSALKNWIRKDIQNNKFRPNHLNTQNYGQNDTKESRMQGLKDLQRAARETHGGRYGQGN